MDPTANLAEQRTICGDIEDGTANQYDIDRLAELVRSLDEWIGNGGFLPQQWQRKGTS